MQTNAHTGTTIDEVTEGIYRINTPLRTPSGDLFKPAIWNHPLALAEDKNANMFFGAGPREGRRDFDLACQIRTVTAFWADIDACKPTVAVQRGCIPVLQTGLMLALANTTKVDWWFSGYLFSL